MTAETLERIVQDRVTMEHLLRCVVQGCCYRTPDADVCEYCGQRRRPDVSRGNAVLSRRTDG
jgi:rRNA maturation endonuclease Nob1